MTSLGVQSLNGYGVAVICLLIASKGESQTSTGASLGRVVPAAELYRQLLQPPKGEFETTARFLERTATGPGRRYAFALPTKCIGRETWDASYDADTEQISVVVAIRGFDLTFITHNLFKHDVLPVACVQTRSSSYPSENAFGARRVVQERHHRIYGLRIIGPSDVHRADGFDYVRVGIPATPAEARRLLPNLRVIVSFVSWGEPESGPTRRETTRHTPTVRWPYDIVWDLRTFFAHEVTLVIRDVRTGRQVAQKQLVIPAELATVGLSRNATNEKDVGGNQVAGRTGTGVADGPPVVDSNQTYFSFQVDKQVEPIPSTQQVAVPEALRGLGVGGEVNAQFVVDTTGKIEIGSFKVLKASNDLFASAVRAHVPHMRFYPAEVAGRKVPQLVQQQFHFNTPK